ncbi:Hypothetical protein Nlim_0496 [Candidatus Nitrosarchaeum limnium SFB1]|jgi:hypothetical protein|uniref:Uncharacterized protein n=1 Tax=Candidatus Nitrosarchaeum limnium SFB1 TaxID=886738 RepID=F3KJ41_9ARCH|nr:Hypothetical protein Nlim_0496 [Candidatus Nitrosarchaeum limnium SFB1]
MKLLLLGLIFLVFFTCVEKSFAIENNSEIEYNILPNKIHEHDTVILELFTTVQGQVQLEKINNLKVESHDKSIIAVVDTQEIHDYKTIVKLDARKEGETQLYVYVEGSKLLEIPIIVYGNNLPRHISLDVFPDMLNIAKNNQGIVTVVLTNENGIPVKADKDYLVKISYSKSGIISLSDSNIIISKGEFSSKQIITGMKEGIVTITAKTDDLETSELVTVEKNPKRTIEIAVVPEIVTSSKSSNTHLIAQLFSDGKLIEATSDITIHFKISSNSELVNTSKESDALTRIGYFQIKKGQTWGETTFSIQKGMENTYTVTATSQDPLVVVEKTFQTMNSEAYDDKEIKFYPLSSLANGNEQLIGVIYLEDTNGHPVIANRDIIIPFSTSDKSIHIEAAIVKKGTDSTLVYGDVGYFVPLDSEIAPQIQNFKPISLNIQGFNRDEVSLKTHLVSNTIQNNEEQWITVYMESSDGNLFKFPDISQIQISDSKIFQIDKSKMQIFPYFILIPVRALDAGEEDVILNIGEFETVISLTSTSSKPDSLKLDYSDNLFNGVKDTFAIQILNSQGLPIEANEDIEVQIFSSDPTVINFPNKVIIPKNSSFVKLEITPKMPGKSDVSLVSAGLPIDSEEITVEEATPSIQISSENIVNEGESFIVSIQAKQNGMPLQNVHINWELEGGITTISDQKTGPTGEAIASVIATSNDAVKIIASIDNGPIQSAFASKIVKVNATTQDISEESTKSFKKPEMGGFDPVLIVIPALIGGVVIFMKKKKSK